MWVGTLMGLALGAPGDVVAVDLWPGGSGEVQVEGQPPGATVVLFWSETGLGAGPCGPADCFGIQAPLTRLDTAVADANGVVRFTVRVPASTPVGTTMAVQARSRSPGGALSDAALLTVTAADADGDGFDTTSDCDDTDAAVHPGATEVCDATRCPGIGRDDDCDGLADEGCAVAYHDVGITTDEVWGPDAEHRVCSAFSIDAQATLTVLDGTTVTFEPGSQLQVHGHLDVQGTDANDPAASRVTFDSAARAPAPGDWVGVEVFGSATLTGLDLAHASSAYALSSLSVLAIDGSLTLERSRVRNGRGAGLYLAGGALVLDEVTVSGHGRAGVVSWMPEDADVSVSHLRVTRNAVAAETRTGRLLAALRLDSDLRGNDEDEIRLLLSGFGHGQTWGSAWVPIVGHLHVVDGLTFGPGTVFSGEVHEAADLTIAGTRSHPVRMVDATLSSGTGGSWEPTVWSHLDLSGESYIHHGDDRPLHVDHLVAHDLSGTGAVLEALGPLVLEDAVIERTTGYDITVGAFGGATLTRVVLDEIDVIAGTPALWLYGPFAYTLEDVVVTNVNTIGILVDPLSEFEGGASLLRVTVDGAVARGIEIWGYDGRVSLDTVTIRNVAPAHSNFRGEGLYLGGFHPASGRITGLVSTGNAYPIVGETIDALDGLPHGNGGYTGNTWDEILVEGPWTSGPTTLPGVGIPYRMLAGLSVDGSGVVVGLEGAELLLDDGGVTVSRGGQLIANDCRLVGGGTSWHGIDATYGVGNVVSLTRCDVSGFNGHGLAFVYDPSAPAGTPEPGIAVTECGLFDNGSCGVSCGCGATCGGTLSSGCELYESVTGSPIIGGSNLVFDNGAGAYCD